MEQTWIESIEIHFWEAVVETLVYRVSQGTPNTQKEQISGSMPLGFHYFQVFGTPREPLKLFFELLDIERSRIL